MVHTHLIVTILLQPPGANEGIEPWLNTRAYNGVQTLVRSVGPRLMRARVVTCEG